MKKKMRDLKKRISILREKSYDRKVENIFGKKKGSKSFIKTLNSLNSIRRPASHPTSCSALHDENNMFNISSEHFCSKFKCSPEHHGNLHETNGSVNKNIFEPATADSAFYASSKCSSRNIHHASKFEHLRHSRFSSTRKVFQHHFYSKHPSFDHPSFSKCSIHRAEGISKFPTHHSSKKILGPTKTLDLSEPEKTSGTHKTFSSSHLSTSSSCKSKDTKCNKSSRKIKSSGTSSPACCPRSTSISRCSTLSRLINGEQPLCFIPVVSTFIILLLVCLLLLKLLHLPFD